MLKLYVLFLRHLFENFYCGKNFDRVESLMEHLVRSWTKYCILPRTSKSWLIAKNIALEEYPLYLKIARAI